MKLLKSAFTLRQKNRVYARMALREERTLSRTVFYFIAPVYISFAIVDWICATYTLLWLFVLIRLSVVCLGTSGYLLMRGRARHGIRYGWVLACYTMGVEAIMFQLHLQYTPYFSGIVMILFSSTAFFPKGFLISSVMFSVIMAPVLLTYSLDLQDQFASAILGLSMAVGGILLSMVNSIRARKNLIETLSLSETLATDLRNREQEVREKADELMKRKRFESQFSPQVVSRILDDKEFYEKLGHQKISVLVVDVKESTTKARTLEPDAYAEVIEEVFDIIAASCLRWNITIDKFTGDGAQAFAGSPEPRPDDLKRTIQACGEIRRMLGARQDYLRLRWKSDVQLRFGICEGEALVGFLGKGSMHSFTAIGNVVSLAHRLCGEAPPDGSILVFSFENKELIESFSSKDYEKSIVTLTNLKGFEGKPIKTVQLKARFGEDTLGDLGRCKTCFTPLVMTENAAGIPRAACPSCSMRTSLEPHFKKNISY